MKFGGFFIAMALVLSACSSDPQPREPEPTSTSAPTSTATPPAMPAQAEEDSPEGAAAFVGYWVDVSNYAAATGDVTELSRISSPDCSGCQKYIDLYRSTYKAGGYFKGGEWKLGELKVEPTSSDTFLSAEVRYAAGTYRTSRDDNLTRTRPNKDQISFAVRDETARKVVSQLGLGAVE